jgi:hypothetical protein
MKKNKAANSTAMSAVNALREAADTFGDATFGDAPFGDAVATLGPARR